jgi:DNA helicase IV
MAHPDIPAEQAYLDHAYECLERMRQALLRTVDAAAMGSDGADIAADKIGAWVERRLAAYEAAEQILCFGRIDVDSVEDPLYVGRRWVQDDDGMLVVNWQAPAARPFYTATPAEPHGVTLRRRFRLKGRTLTGISDEALDGSLEDAAAAVDDFLLEELERTRDARMRDIVATIQADQYGLIARDPEPPLVIQGGPGTGKTAVGLHRASYLLFSHRDALRRILMVGPNPVFMDYVSHVLPSLGEDAVDQLAVVELVDGADVTLSDSPDVERLKADARMAEVVRRAVELRTRGEPRELVVRMEGLFVGVRQREVAELRSAARAELGLSAAARERFRMDVLRRFYADYGAKLGGLAVRAFDEVEKSLRKDGVLNEFLDAVWPAPRPERLVRQLLASRERLAEAADGILDEDEQRLFRRARSGWSAADLPLLDEARALLQGPPVRYGHVIVDEAQDLSPMQLRMIARRAVGAFTILGDVAQATGPVPYDRWDEVLAQLPGGIRAEVEELRHAYRVPREIMALALPLLDHIAPDVVPPVAYRTGAEPPRIVSAESPLDAAYAEAARLAGSEGLLAVIAPPSLRGDAEAAPGSLFDESRLSILTPRESKGMEFDHVIVVEPAQIVEEAVGGHAQGLRELYVALTRPTTTLVVVHARPLPRELAAT